MNPNDIYEAIKRAEDAVVPQTSSAGDIEEHLELEVKRAQARVGVAVIGLIEAKQVRTRAKATDSVKLAQEDLSRAMGLLEAWKRLRGVALGVSESE